MNKLAEHNLKVKKEIIGVQRNWKYWGEGIRAMEKTIKKGQKPKTSFKSDQFKHKTPRSTKSGVHKKKK